MPTLDGTDGLWASGGAGVAGGLPFGMSLSQLAQYLSPQQLMAFLASQGQGAGAPMQLPGATPAQPAGTVQTRYNNGAPVMGAVGNALSAFNPVSPAAAAENDPKTALNAALAAQAAGNPQAQDPRLSAAANLPPPMAPASPQSVPSANPSILPQARGAAVPPGPMTPGSSILPQGAAQGVQPYGPPTPASMATSAPGSSPGGTSTARPATPNLGYYQPFSTFSYQNPNSLRNAPVYTARNFGNWDANRSPSAASAPKTANRASGVASAPGPAPRGALATSSSTPYGYLNQGQLAANPPLPPTMPASVANQRVASAINNPNWWRNLIGIG